MSGDGGVWMPAGPRGRRLCRALLDGLLTGPAWWAAVAETTEPQPSDLVAELVPAVAEVLADGFAEDDLFRAFAHAVDLARYWQEPDGVDRALAHREVRDALLPLGHAVASAAPGWWSDQLALQDQRIVEWADATAVPPSLTGAAAKVAAWRAATVDDEKRSVERPRDVCAMWSGSWWSAPCLGGLPSTTRALPWPGAVGAALMEDHPGWTAAACRPVRTTTAPRVFEIRDAADWVDLVDRYPLDVTLSRRHDWWRTTGTDSSWLIPDYEAVRQDYDAVHLTARAYLTTAGVAWPVGDASTVLAGWNPDETYWLTDCLTT